MKNGRLVAACLLALMSTQALAQVPPPGGGAIEAIDAFQSTLQRLNNMNPVTDLALSGEAFFRARVQAGATVAFPLTWRIETSEGAVIAGPETRLLGDLDFDWPMHWVAELDLSYIVVICSDAAGNEVETIIQVVGPVLDVDPTIGRPIGYNPPPQFATVVLPHLSPTTVVYRKKLTWELVCQMPNGYVKMSNNYVKFGPLGFVPSATQTVNSTSGLMVTNAALVNGTVEQTITYWATAAYRTVATYPVDLDIVTSQNVVEFLDAHGYIHTYIMPVWQYRVSKDSSAAANPSFPTAPDPNWPNMPAFQPGRDTFYLRLMSQVNN